MNPLITEIDSFPSNTSQNDIIKWFRKKINIRDVPPEDVYQVASKLYNYGRFIDVVSCIEFYRSLNGHIKKEADHLQAYAYWKLTLVPNTQECLSNALKFTEFQNDWQLLVEASIINEEDKDDKVEEEIDLKFKQKLKLDPLQY